jgi:hypothetical protein
MKRISIALCVIFTVAAGAAVAGSNTTYNFLRSDVGARAAALGGSFISMTDDPVSIFYNPSALATLSSTQVSFGFFKHLLDINSGYASYGQEVADLGHIGAGIVYVNYGEFTRTDELGNKLGTFSANELALSVGYASELMPRVKYGANLKFIYSQIAEAASSAMAIDLGALYKFDEPRLMVGFSLLNLGTQLDPYLSTRESLPVDFKIGATIEPEHVPVLLNLNFHHLNETESDFVGRFRAFSVGAEFTVSEEIQLRAGYNNERRRELKIGSSTGLAGFSLGAGVMFDQYKVDYAFNSYGTIGSLHRVSVGIAF